MRNYGLTSIHEFLGDCVVYRNLVPADGRLPALAQLRGQVGLPEGSVPRKSEPGYARAIVHILQQARALDAPSARIQRLVFVGDTRMNDGTAFANLCRAGGWPGLAFIGADRDEPAWVEIVEQVEGALYLANRWTALAGFEGFCRQRSFAADEGTALVLDLDKTTLGARGRNDAVIDGARVEAVRRTVGDALGARFDPAAFEAAYARLNRPEFHPFTGDNQDYLAYVCLVLGSGLDALDALLSEINSGQLRSFTQFIARVDGRAAELPARLRPIHADIYARVQQGDPTPFKAFRYHEYRATVERMGCLGDGAPVEQLLAEEIAITQEVRDLALAWRARGALLFGLSDKPDEAATPTADLAAQGYRPIHRMRTHAVGQPAG